MVRRRKKTGIRAGNCTGKQTDNPKEIKCAHLLLEAGSMFRTL